MKSLFVLGILVALSVGGQCFTIQSEWDRLLPPLEKEPTPSSLETRTYLTRVDHFRPQDTRVARFVTNNFLTLIKMTQKCVFY